MALLCVGLASNQETVLAQGKGKNKSISTPNKTFNADASANANAVNNSNQSNQNNNSNQSNLSYPRYSSSENSIKAKVDAVASYYKLDPGLVGIIVEKESGFNPHARSSADAMGLMQMIPSTAKRFGVRDPYNADESLHGGCRYFVWLLRRYNGRLDLALAGYNAGEGAVERHGNRVPPYKETQDYVRSITNKYLVKLGVKRTNQTKTNQVSTQPKQTFKYVSNQHNSQYKSVKTTAKRQTKHNINKVFVKSTKEKLDMLDSYLQKK